MWIIEGKDIYYNQFAQVTFLCPMRFERYPLDEHICKFRVGSTNMDINYMRFGETEVTYDESSRNTILDYKVEARKLREEDRILTYQGTNYSVTGSIWKQFLKKILEWIYQDYKKKYLARENIHKQWCKVLKFRWNPTCSLFNKNQF